MIKHLPTLLFLFLSVLFSFTVSRSVLDVDFMEFYEIYLFPAASVLVGVSIAVAGLFLTVIIGVRSKLIQLAERNSSANFLGELQSITGELRDNTLFSLLAYCMLVSFPIVKDVGVMFLAWPDIDFVSRSVFLNTVAVTCLLVLIIAIMDTVSAAFKLVELENVK